MKFGKSSRMVHLGTALTGVVIGLFSHSAIAGTADEIAMLKEQMSVLQARLEALEAQVAEKQQAEAPVPQALLKVDRQGLVATGVNKDFSFRIRPRIQVDARLFPDEEDGTSGIELRRLRPTFQGNAGKLSWRFTPELAGTVRVLDAWADYQMGKSVWLRVGKTKSVIGYERLQAFSQTLFPERGYPSLLTPTRDLGIEIHGSGPDGVLDWTVGVYNGVLDDTDLSSNTNLDGDSFDAGARVAITPIPNQPGKALSGLTFGLAIMAGREDTLIDDGDRDRRIRYRTPGRNTLFRYNDAVAVKGDRLRINPFASWYRGPVGLLGEYVRSSQEISRNGLSRKVDAEAWTVQASWVMTGEPASYGAVRPRRPFDPSAGGWGAFEAGVRYQRLRVGGEAFAGGAGERLARNNATQEAESSGIVLKWYLSDNLMAAFDFESTEFGGLGAVRPTEQLFLSRLQVEF